MEKYNLIKDIEPIKIEKINRKKFRFFICEECGEEYNLNIYQYKNKKKYNIPNLCFICADKRKRAKQSKSAIRRFSNMTKEEKEKYANKQRNYYNNLTSEEKEAWAQRSRDQYTNMTPEQKELNRIRLIKIAKDYRDNMSKEEKEIESKRMSERNIEWHKNMTKEQKEEKNRKISIRQLQYYINMTNEEKEARSKKLSLAQLQRHKNMSKEEKEEINKKKSISLKNYYNDLPKEEWQENKRQIAIENNRKRLLDKEVLGKEIDVNDKGVPNKLELEFKNILDKYNIEYLTQMSNENIHKDFNTIFPYNPIYKTDRIEGTHTWDFLIYLEKEILPIFVDIDGRSHNENINKKIHSYHNKFTYKEIDLNKFNDSQRPYQIDDNKAFIVEALEGKLLEDINVVCIENNKVINNIKFIDFIKYLIE